MLLYHVVLLFNVRLRIVLELFLKEHIDDAHCITVYIWGHVEGALLTPDTLSLSSQTIQHNNTTPVFVRTEQNLRQTVRCG